MPNIICILGYSPFGHPNSTDAPAAPMPTATPRAALPPILRSDTPGTWAHDTMSRRVRTEILARVFRENIFDPGTVSRLKALDTELANADVVPLSPIEEDGGPDVETWNSLLSEVLDKRETWLTAPWSIAEFYLYRRLMTALSYFESPVDPFKMQKELGLTSALDSITMLAHRVNGVLNDALLLTTHGRRKDFQGFALTALWGNRMDLSLWPVGGDGQNGTGNQSSGDRAAEAFSNVLKHGQRMILANSMDQLCDYIEENFGKRMDIIVDNAGFELFCDLCLADYLVCSGLASTVHVQLKAHPTFVSDAMAKDVTHTIKVLQSGKKERGADTAVSMLGDRWAQHVASGKWILTENFFWVQPQAMWDMPVELRKDLGDSALVFVKGDANYRRLLGDRDWELDTPFNDVLSYFPAPVCALRTLKAELGCGMDKEATARAAREDERWLVAGKYGVIQFCNTTLY